MSVVLATKAAGLGAQGVKAAGNVSQEVFGYDFVGLAIKIIILQVLGLLISKYIELVNGANNVLRGLLGLLGVGVPNFLPPQIVQFYTSDHGYYGVKYWDLVKALTILLLIMEYSRYVKAQKMTGGTPSAMTEGIFFMLIGFFLIITVPEMFTRIKEVIAAHDTTIDPGVPF